MGFAGPATEYPVGVEVGVVDETHVEMVLQEEPLKPSRGCKLGS